LPALPSFDLALMQAVLPDAIAFTLLGAIESLLSAVVADGMTGRRHRSNCELVAQGFANIGSALFGGICVTGTIARTATNVRSGAHGPVAGMLHVVFLLVFIAGAAPLASYIPLAALAGVLAVVAWNMVEKTAFAALIRSSWGDALVLLVTFALVVFRDLTEGIVVGFEAAARKAERAGVRFVVVGASQQVRRVLFTNGVLPPHVRYKATLAKALKQIRSERVEVPSQA
jgi:SulP family sulfate permease